MTTAMGPAIDPVAEAIAVADQWTEPAPAVEADTPKRAEEILFILESGDMERTWAALIMANGAAASGVKVSLFLTFWGFYPLVKPGVRVTGQNWMQKMLAVMNRPGIDHLKMSRLNFVGMGPWMCGQLAKKHNVALPAEMLEIATSLGVRLLPCQMSMDLFGIKREDLIDGLEEPVGVATVIEMITRGVPAIFI
ncbi:MAG: DsrE/DsrF/DrsH-like family protein [Candidatus Limnocylindrales bacterium]